MIFASHAEAVQHYKKMLNQEREAFVVEIVRRLKRVRELEELVEHNQKMQHGGLANEPTTDR